MSPFEAAKAVPATNFILVEVPAQREAANEALDALTLDTPAREIFSDQMKDFQRLFARQFGEF